MPYDIERTKCCCSVTGRELQEGEIYYAVLREIEGQLVRTDYSQQAWQGAPSGVFGFWKSRVSSDEQAVDPKPKVEAVLQLFDQLYEHPQPGQEAIPFILALLLMQSRVFRLDEVETEEAGDFWKIFCARRNRFYRVRDPQLGEEQLKGQQESLLQVLGMVGQ